MSSTDLGYVNRNQQRNNGKTNMPGTDNLRFCQAERPVRTECSVLAVFITKDRIVCYLARSICCIVPAVPFSYKNIPVCRTTAFVLLSV